MEQKQAHQRVFDHVLTSLREQGVASISSEGNCKYRGENGAKCAVGHLIDDNVYHPNIEGILTQMIDRARRGDPAERRAVTAIEEAWGLELLKSSRGAPKDEEFLSQMQVAHDTRLKYHGMGDFEVAMRGLADSYGLVYTEPKP